MAFSFFRKLEPKISLKTDPIGFFLLNESQDIESCREAIPENYVNGNYDYVAMNSNSAIKSIIIRHALLLRSKKDYPAAEKELEFASEFLDYIVDAIAKADAKGLVIPPNQEGVHESNFIFVSNLLYAFLVTLLSKEWQKAKHLAGLIKLPVILGADGGHEDSVDGDSYDDLITQMFAATILDDKNEFTELQKRYHHNIKDKDYFFEKYFNYDQMMESIIDRDESSFNEYLPNQEQNYLSRRHDKKTDAYDAIYGVYHNNERVYDMWATALCNIAIHRGIEVTHTSEIIPASFFNKI